RRPAAGSASTGAEKCVPADRHGSSDGRRRAPPAPASQVAAGEGSPREGPPPGEPKIGQGIARPSRARGQEPWPEGFRGPGRGNALAGREDTQASTFDTAGAP